MGFYGTFIYPHVQVLTGRLCQNPELDAIIHAQARRARGSVLEIGIGAGGILGLYDADGIHEVYGLDPHPKMIEKAARAAQHVVFPVKLLCAPAERIPLEDDSVDTVFSTITFCSIPDLPLALREMRRVLRPGGELLFFEHGLHPDPKIAERQRRGEARHKWLYNGCHLTRDIPGAIEAAGFTFLENNAGEHPFGWLFPHLWGWYGAAS